MAYVNLISSPDPNLLHPVENCIQFCVGFIDVVTTAGQPASAQVNFQQNSPYATGLEFVFAGEKFTTGTDPGLVDLSSNDQNVQAANFVEAVTNHPNFAGQVSAVITPGGVTTIVVVTWDNVGQRQNHTCDFSAFAPNPEGPKGSGFSAEYVPGFEFVYMVECLDDFARRSIAIHPQNSPYVTDEVTGDVLNDCVSIHKALSKIVRTTIPNCDSGMAEDGTIWKDITIRYGHQQAADPCGVDKFPLQEAPTFRIWNGACNLEEGDGGGDYFVRGSGGTTPLFFDNVVKFLRSGPTTRQICLDACDWLWIHLNGQTFEPITNYRVLYTFFAADGATIQSNLVVMDGANRTNIIPSGTANAENAFAGTVPWEIVDRYTIQLSSFGNGASQDYSETYTYQVCKGCCPKYNIYFLDTKGGYNFISFDKVDFIELTDTYEEICRDVTCGGTYNERLLQGDFRYNSDSVKRISLQATSFPKNTQTQRLLEAFKQSDSKFIMFEDDQGGKNPRRILVEPGAVRIYQRDGKLSITAVVIESQEYLKPSEA